MFSSKAAETKNKSNARLCENSKCKEKLLQNFMMYTMWQQCRQ